MKSPQTARSKSATHARSKSPKFLVAKVKRLTIHGGSSEQECALSEAYRDILRSYRRLLSSGAGPLLNWQDAVREALGFLGGQADRHTASLADYDHHHYGPYLGISDEGAVASAIRRAAYASPKARALGAKPSPLAIGVALDAERLGSIGELPVGPDEFAEIWRECVGQILMTTNIGSRANLRFYSRAPLIAIPGGKLAKAIETAKAGLTVAFKPFVEAPGGPRPVIVFVEFALGSKRAVKEQREILASIVEHARGGSIGSPGIHKVGLNVRVGWGRKGCDAVLSAIDLASSVGIENLSVDGVVRKDADTVLSLPGLLNYFPPDLVSKILSHASAQVVVARAINMPDPDSVAREIWSALNTARAMGLDLGKYGLFPLSLEECDTIVGQVQKWFPDWCAAPVFYIDQGLVSKERVYVGDDLADGVKAWLRVVARHKVRIVLIDTVDKSKSWKILKTGDDPKGILKEEQIAHLNALGEQLGIKILWAGGITLEQAYSFGRLGVFGIYVTTAASKAAPVRSEYLNDPELAAEKRPTFTGVAMVKTLLEGGFLLEGLASKSPEIHDQLQKAGPDPEKLSRILPAAWLKWWQIHSPTTKRLSAK